MVAQQAAAPPASTSAAAAAAATVDLLQPASPGSPVAACLSVSPRTTTPCAVQEVPDRMHV